RRPAEETDLGGVGRLVAWQPALALEALEHRRFLAADIGAGAPPEMDARRAVEAARLELRDLLQQHLPHRRILVAQIDVDLRRLDHPGSNQHALEEAVRIGLE